MSVCVRAHVVLAQRSRNFLVSEKLSAETLRWEFTCTVCVCEYFNLPACRCECVRTCVVLFSIHVACVCVTSSLCRTVALRLSNSDCKCYSFTSQQALGYWLVSTASKVVINREKESNGERHNDREK